MADEKGVQQGAVPLAGTAPAVGEPPKPPEPSPEAKLAEQIQKAVATEVAKMTEVARREIQSAKDKAKAEVDAATRRARAVEETSKATRQHLQGLDPEAAKEYELAEYRAKEQNRQLLEQEEEQTRLQAEVVQNFQGNMTQFITGLGINPEDKRIDWGAEAGSLLDRQRRILDSVTKIQKENMQAQQTTQSGLEKRLKDLEELVKRANIEVNSVSTAASQGAPAGSDAEFLKKFGAGEIESTKENLERIKKIQGSY